MLTQVKSLRFPAFAALALGLSASIATACCCVGPRDKPIVFGDQTNIVIWDAASKTEHFIRDAKFRSDAPNFGFIAPTPSKPDLSEASSEAFDTLAKLKPIERRVGDVAMATGAAETAVDVIQQVDVAGYRATTLLASDSTALADWMRHNGYQTTPAVETWTKAYIAKGWYLTAFKVLDKNQVASTGTVRMSFKTDRPFNPFYVPSDNIKEDQKGTLKVFFVATGDYQATVGKSEPWQDAVWNAPVPTDIADRLAGQLKLPPSAIPRDAQVEAFEDNDFPRAASDDIYFSKHGSNLVPAGVGVLLVGGLGFWLWRRMRLHPH